MDPRRSRYRILSIALAVGFVCAVAVAQDGATLLHKMQPALSGADKIAAIRDFDETVSAQTYNARGESTGATVRKRMRWIRPNILRLDETNLRVCGLSLVPVCQAASCPHSIGLRLPPLEELRHVRKSKRGSQETERLSNGPSGNRFVQLAYHRH